MSTTPEAGPSLRERATAVADRLSGEYASMFTVAQGQALRLLIMLAYLEGDQYGTDNAIEVLRRELSEL
jgi:hypothetical protein